MRNSKICINKNKPVYNPLQNTCTFGKSREIVDSSNHIQDISKLAESSIFNEASFTDDDNATVETTPS